MKSLEAPCSGRSQLYAGAKIEPERHMEIETAFKIIEVRIDAQVFLT